MLMFDKNIKQTYMWGRNINPSFLDILSCLSIFILSPLFVFCYIHAALYENYNLLSTILKSYHPIAWITSNFYSLIFALGMVAVWVLFQIILACIPDIFHYIYPNYQGGIKNGSITPAGFVHKYNINGFQAWIISTIIFLYCGCTGWISPTIVYDYWEDILIIAAILGYIIAAMAYIKAYVNPTNAKDRKFTNSRFYDYFMGIELNPRFGSFDWKLFLNGRPGIIGWSIINLSFAFAQFEEHGYITNSMILVNFLQFLYIGYFFYREAWYLKTIDISHDHFGWMFAFGDLVWLPSMYTLQALYLVGNPVNLSLCYFCCVLALGLIGFYIFADSNNEKDRFRSRQYDATTKILKCQYTTENGKSHQSELLISGWWGKCRHINYTGDLMLSLAYSLACGVDNVFPYFYIVYLTILLVHRCIRDEAKCRGKYGEVWDRYCKIVPYRFISGIY